MARQEPRFGPPRLAVVNDATTPTAPQTASPEGPVTANPIAAGVADVQGCKSLLIDVHSHTSDHGTATLQPIVWNQDALRWFNFGSPINTVADKDARYVVDDLAGRFAYVMVSAVAGTVDIWTGGIIEVGTR